VANAGVRTKWPSAFVVTTVLVLRKPITLKPRTLGASLRWSECKSAVSNSYCDYGRARSQQLHVIVTLTNAGEVAEWLKAAVC
jgi:hypothetical protein